MSNTKTKVAVFFGGVSSEHDISCISAATVIKAIDIDKYDTVLIGITKEGKWLLADSVESIENGEWARSEVTAMLSPDPKANDIIVCRGNEFQRIHIDVTFPVLHGMYGEDGTIQGLFEMAGIPYVGCGVLASAVSMDKAYTKLIVDHLDVRQAKFVLVDHISIKDMDGCISKVEAALNYPVFVKPSKAGSSCGVSKARNKAELVNALNIAIQHDKRILVEETIVGRELECGVLGGYYPEASGVGEIVAGDEWYSFDAKYNNSGSRTDIHPLLPEGIEDKIRKSAVDIFKALDCFGISRVDFFLEKGTDEIVFNEINTMPGFTAISMYPMLWEEKGISKTELVDRLIKIAMER